MHSSPAYECSDASIFSVVCLQYESYQQDMQSTKNSGDLSIISQTGARAHYKHRRELAMEHVLITNIAGN